MAAFLVLAPHYHGVGGIQRYTRQFTRAMTAAAGAQSVAAWSYLSGTVSDGSDLRYAGAATARSGMWGKARFVAGAARLARGARLVIAAHVSIAPIARWLSSVYRVPYAVIAYGIDVWGALPPARSAALRNAHRVVAISRFTARRLQQDHGVAADRILIIPPVVDPAFVDRGEALRPRTAGALRRVLTVARLAAVEGYKGCDTVLQALARLRGSLGPVQYVVVGDGDDRPRLQALAKELGIGTLTHFTGAIPDSDLAAWYERSDVIVMPSRGGYRDGRWQGEGFGIVFIEGGAFGLPSIAGRGDGGEEAVEDGVTGYVVDGHDAAAVADVLRRLLADDALRLRMGQAARARVLRDFTLARMERQVGQLLGHLAPQV